MEYVQDYLDSLLTDGKSENTYKGYAQDLKTFFKFCPKPVAQITIMDLRQYLNMLTTNGKAVRTRTRAMAAIGGYLKFLVDNEVLQSNPADKIKKPKIPKSLPKFLTHEELQGIIEAATCIRTKSIIHTLYATGARVSELCNLNRDDINLETRRVNIQHGKGDKQRFVMLSDTAVGLLKEYWAGRTDDGLAAFLNEHGNRLNPSNVQELVRGLGKKTGVKQKVHPHLFRKSVASHMVQKGVSIQIVSEYLGHSNLDTTKIYASLVDTQRAEAFDLAINSAI